MDEAKLKQIFVEYLEAARQSGKSETSGLVAALIASLDEYSKNQFRIRDFVYILLIVVLLAIYSLSFVYVINTQVTQSNLNDAVASAMEEYLEINQN